MTEDEAYELLATHRMLEDKERPGNFHCGAISCPHQYHAMASHNWQAHRRHWAKLFADATNVFYSYPCVACGGRMLKSNVTAIYPFEGMLHRHPCADLFPERGFGSGYPRVNDEALA